jgi:hypothetical protein
MRNKAVGFLIVGMFGVFAPSTSNACFCIMPEVPQAVKQANAVFVGEVSGITDPLTKDDKAPPPGRFYIIKFKVEKSWKGVAFFPEVSVLSAQGGDECFAYPAVHKGEKYLVFADPFYLNGVLQKRWSIITACNRTKLLGNAVEDLKRLGPVNVPSLDFRRRRKGNSNQKASERRKAAAMNDDTIIARAPAILQNPSRVQ